MVVNIKIQLEKGFLFYNIFGGIKNTRAHKCKKKKINTKPINISEIEPNWKKKFCEIRQSSQ